MSEFENEIRSLDQEVAGVYGDRGPALVFAKAGGPDWVYFSPREQRIMADRLLTHNHPSQRSLSADDVYLGWRWRLREVRVVTSGAGYWLRSPNDGWEPYAWSEIQELIVQTASSVDSDIEAGLVEDKDAEHEIWRRLTALTAITYGYI